MDYIVAVRVTLDTGQSRYVLTWGRMGTADPWPGDIERAVLKASERWSLGGTPVACTVCDSLQEASGERFFYECLMNMQSDMPRTGTKKFWAWADKMTAAAARGEELYFCGVPRGDDEPAPNPEARFGYRLEWFPKGGDELAGCRELPDLTPQHLQVLLDDPDLDRVMVMTFQLHGDALTAISGRDDPAVEETRFDYFVTPWAEGGFRTPRGYVPPPSELGPAFSEFVRVRPAP
jgi:hypothetical protein